MCIRQASREGDVAVTSERERRKEQLHIRMRPTEREALRALAGEEGRDQSKVVRDLIREAVAARRAAQAERWSSRLFGTGAPPDEAA